MEIPTCNHKTFRYIMYQESLDMSHLVEYDYHKLFSFHGSYITGISPPHK